MSASRRTRLAASTAFLVLATLMSGCGSSAGAAASWSAVTTPLPAGADGGGLIGVSCTSAGNCWAVGDYTDGSRKTLAVRWNGKKWSVVSSPNPKGATSSHLLGVSCPTATTCFAVGAFSTASAVRTLVERWNGKTWSIVASPSSTGGKYSQLAGVSCASATACFAVGTFRDVSGPRKTLIERWNGTSWSLVAHPKLNGGHRDLFGVSCSSATSCFAVGTHSVTGGGELACEPELDCSASTLIERWNGKSWAVVASPNGKYPAFQSTLTGVSCVSGTSCVAVGTASPEGTYGKMLTERWDGKRWSVVAGANPAGFIGSALNGVSCISATNCIAGGAYQAPGSTRTIVDRYNGTSWSIVYRPNLSGWLRGVSCTSATSCVAVGGTSIQRLGAPT